MRKVVKKELSASAKKNRNLRIRLNQNRDSLLLTKSINTLRIINEIG